MSSSQRPSVRSRSARSDRQHRVIAPNGVIVREAKSKESALVGRLDRGEIVDVGIIDELQMRVQIKAPMRGWVSQRRESDGLLYLEPVSAPQAPPTLRHAKMPLLGTAPSTQGNSTRYPELTDSSSSHGSGTTGVTGTHSGTARSRSAKTRLYNARQRKASLSRSPTRHHQALDQDETGEFINGTQFCKNQRVFSAQPILVSGVEAVARGVKGVVVGPSTNPEKSEKIAVVFGGDLYNVNATSIGDGAAIATPSPSRYVSHSPPRQDGGSAYHQQHQGGYGQGGSPQRAMHPLPGAESAAGDKTSRVIASLSSKYIAGVLDERTYEESLRSLLGDRYDAVVGQAQPVSPRHAEGGHGVQALPSQHSQQGYQGQPYGPPSHGQYSSPAASPPLTPPPPESAAMCAPYHPYPSSVPGAPGISSDRIDELRRSDPVRYSMFCAISSAYLNKSMSAPEYRESLNVLLGQFR